MGVGSSRYVDVDYMIIITTTLTSGILHVELVIYFRFGNLLRMLLEST